MIIAIAYLFGSVLVTFAILSAAHYADVCSERITGEYFSNLARTRAASSAADSLDHPNQSRAGFSCASDAVTTSECRLKSGIRCLGRHQRNRRAHRLAFWLAVHRTVKRA